MGQNCEVDFPGTAILNFSSSCGSSTSNLILGKNIYFGNGDIFTFDLPVNNVGGNIHLNAEGSGKIIIPAGVTVNVDGNFHLDPQSSGCSSANPCIFEIEVNGNFNISNNFHNNLMTLVWSGSGTVVIDADFKNSSNGCMVCGAGGCPNFQFNPADCEDDGACPGGDFCTLISSCSSDVTPPVINGCPADQVVNITGPGCTQTVSWMAPSATDNCNMSSFIGSHSPGVFPKGITTVVYTATDAAGNTAICSFNVNVVDNIPPVITGCSTNITASANASCQATISWTAPGFSDNCAGATLGVSKASGSLFNIGTTQVIYTATDAAGNTATCSFNVNVVDNIPPVITGCPTNITASANASCQATVSWTAPGFSDNCAGATLGVSKASGSLFNIGTTQVIYTATDAAGNTATCTFMVNVVDNIPPVITGCPTNITASADASCQATVSWTAPGFSDNCAGAMLGVSKAPGSLFNIGITTVVYTATDAAGNAATCSFTVTVNDVTPPFILEHADIVETAGPSCTAKVNFSPPTSEDCGPVVVTSSHQPGHEFPVGITEVLYTATDIVGNQSTNKFNVIVEDQSVPVFQNCVTDIIVNANSTCSAVVNWALPSVTDNCGGVTISSSHNPGETFPLGITPVSYTAIDNKGNVSTCVFNVIVKNETAPTISNCPRDISLTGNEAGIAAAEWTEPTASTPCGAVTMIRSHDPGDFFYVGTTKIEYQATADEGNTSYCYFNVIVSQMDIEIDVGKVVTPDGNGINDAWVLHNIEKFPNNKVVIVDRWGGLIFNGTGYDNENVVWRGTNRSGHLVPTGTYFYTVSVRFGSDKVEKSGFIELVR